MAKIPTSTEQLLNLNRQIKRRVDPCFIRNKPILVDSKNRIIDAKPTGHGFVIQISGIEQPPHPARSDLNGRPYLINLDYMFALNEWEASIVLGLDYAKEPTPLGINAMLEACCGGPGLSNAYSLGISYSGISKDPNCRVIPVQYYLISKKSHKSLSLENNKKILEKLLIEDD